LFSKNRGFAEVREEEKLDFLADKPEMSYNNSNNNQKISHGNQLNFRNDNQNCNQEEKSKLYNKTNNEIKDDKVKKSEKSD